MRLSVATITLLAGLAVALPGKNDGKNENSASTRDNDATLNAIEQIQAAFDDPKGFPAGEGDPRDANGDGLIDPQEFNSRRTRRSPQQRNGGKRAGKRAKANRGGNAVDQIQAAFDDPKGFPAGEGDTRDRNGDGLIDPQEFNSR